MINLDIVDWLKDKPYWQQLIANDILLGSKFESQDFEDIYTVFKQENKLINSELSKKELPFLKKEHSKKINKDSLKWRGVKDVRGLNAIESGAGLNIGDQVTLIYGENGSGKSGFTRLLNNVFVSRGDKSILSNIYSDKHEKLSAKIIFENEQKNLDEEDLVDIVDSSRCKRVAVFDTSSAMNDLTKESELSFSPIEFKFFDIFVEVILQIKNKFDKEVQEHTSENSFISYFDKETSIKKEIISISEKTDINMLEKLAEITEKDITANSEREKEKVKLVSSSLNLKNEVQEYRKLITDILSIKEKLILLNIKFSSERLAKLSQLVDDRNKYKKLSSLEGLNQFQNDDIENLGSEEWKNFILSAKKYYKTIDHKTDSCIFCQQNLENTDLIDRYWVYLSSEAEKNLTKAEKDIEKLKNDFSSINIEILIENSKTGEWLKENQKELYDALFKAEFEFKELSKEIILSLNQYNFDNINTDQNLNLDLFESVVKLLNKRIEELDINKINEEIKKIELNNYEHSDKIKLKGLIPQINIFIQKLKWISIANKCKITTNHITIFQKKLFSKYVTNHYIKQFNDECKKLNANFLAEISQRGKGGAILNKLTIKNNVPTKILSEGEQRSIALANFLAETSLHNENICMVFDDPVSSLDYKRRELIVDRLAEEAKNKQVVIFTHDLTFLLSMQNKCSMLNLDCVCTTILKIKTTTGIVDDKLPWIGATVKIRTGYLKNELQNIRSVYKNTKTPQELNEYNRRAKLWCEELRETWERSIEELLFNGAVQRFSPSIETQRLKKAPFSYKLYSEIESGMKKCSDWVHDRAAGLGDKVPTPEELDEYLSECERFTAKVRKLIN